MEATKCTIASISNLINAIQKNEKVGTAYERYESSLLWDLGQRVREYSQIIGQNSDVVGEIMIQLQECSIKCQPVLLKNAETITRVWPKRETYIADTKDVPYGKLRDALPILDPDFIINHKLSQKDRKSLIEIMSDSTFEEFRLYVKKVKLKYDPMGETVDFDEMFNDVYELAADLKNIVENNDISSLERFRAMFKEGFIEYTRKLIASMKSEDTLKKLQREIDISHKSLCDCTLMTIENSLVKVANDLFILFKSSETRRDALRRRIGLSELGKLSTLLKATLNESERQRYLRSRQILERFANRASKP